MSRVNLISNPHSSTRLIQYLQKLFFLGSISMCIFLIYTIGSRNLVPNRLVYRIIFENVGDRNSTIIPDISAKDLLDVLRNKTANRITSDQPKLKTKIDEQKSAIETNKSENSNDEFPDPNYKEADLAKIKKAKECYTLKEPDANVQLFDDIEKLPPKPDKSIFFIDSTCLNKTRVEMNARQACTIESAAKLNPNRDVYVLYLSPVGFARNEPDTPIIAALRSYRNIHFRNVNIYKFSQNAPAEQWVKQDRIFTSSVFVVHLSDYLRFVALYKFGGIYEDLDFINIKTFDSLPPNFAPQQDHNGEYINNSAVGFASKDFGHTFIEKILRECIEKYNPNAWDYNGPKAISRAMKKICKKIKVVDMMRKDYCGGFKITPQAVFFPLKPFFEAFETNSGLVSNSKRQITNETVAIHVWSSRTKRISIWKRIDSSIYLRLAEQFCPKAYAASGTYFN